MDKRFSERYESSQLPDELTRVSLVLKDGACVEAFVLNICSHGMGVELPPSGDRTACIQKNETFKVHFSLEHAVFSGLCVYADTATSGCSRLGIYFYYPGEQNTIYRLLKNKSLLEDRNQEAGSGGMDFFVNKGFVKHEWEERVRMLCDSDDPVLRTIGLREMEVLRRGQPPENFEG